MGKAPAFQFYVKDWLTDPELRLVSPSTRGIWIDLLCYMWQSNTKGTLVLSNEQIGKLTGSENGDVERFLTEARQYRFCDISVTDNGLSQICNRRMSREEKIKESNRLRQKKYREAQRSNAKVTPLSPSPTPSPVIYSAKKFSDFWEIYPKKIAKKKCLEKWKLRKLDSMADRLIEDVKERLKTKKWQDGFIPNPLTYINGDRWEDELETTTQQKTPQQIDKEDLERWKRSRTNT